MFSVKADEDVELIEQTVPQEPAAGTICALRGAELIQEQILRHPTFFQHFTGVMVDWTYFKQRDRAQLEEERGWLERQKMEVIADFSPDCNLFPGFAFLDGKGLPFDETVRSFARPSATTCRRGDVLRPPCST